MDHADLRLRRRARALLDEPGWATPLAAAQGDVAEPVPIVDATGELERWFLPVVDGDRLLGFFVFGLDGRVHRWSTFQRDPATADGCPAAADWLDEDVIVRRATEHAGDAPTGAPALSFDGAPDRLAWRVPFGGRIAFVAGPAVWIA